MPEFRVIFVRKVLIFKYARYERQKKLNIKDSSNRLEPYPWDYLHMPRKKLSAIKENRNESIKIVIRQQ
jgi:hypothetical protein